MIASQNGYSLQRAIDVKVHTLTAGLFVAAIISTGCGACSAKVLQFVSSISQLSGKVIVEDQYGPPNFGENPETDLKEKVLILQLDSPVDVAGVHEKGSNMDSFWFN